MNHSVVLTTEDIDLLFLALDSWEKEAGQSGLLTALMGAMLIPGEKGESIGDRKMKDAELETTRRKRNSVLLKAKLIAAIDQSAQANLFSKCNISTDSDA